MTSASDKARIPLVPQRINTFFDGQAISSMHSRVYKLTIVVGFVGIAIAMPEGRPAGDVGLVSCNATDPAQQWQFNAAVSSQTQTDGSPVCHVQASSRRWIENESKDTWMSSTTITCFYAWVFTCVRILFFFHKIQKFSCTSRYFWDFVDRFVSEMLNLDAHRCVSYTDC